MWGRKIAQFIFAALIVLFTLQFTSFSEHGRCHDPGIPDTVLFEGICYYLADPPYSGKLKVPIVFFNDDDAGLMVLTVPLIWSGPVVLDSASYAGSRVEYMASKHMGIDSVNSKAILAVVDFSDDVPAGRGLFNTLYFTISDTGHVEIDTTYYPPGATLYFSNWGAMGWTPQFVKLQFDISPYTTGSGDVNQDGWADIVDVVFLANYLFRSGPPPSCSPECGDVNCDWKIDITDVIYLINYLFKRGDRPYYTPCG